LPPQYHYMKVAVLPWRMLVGWRFPTPSGRWDREKLRRDPVLGAMSWKFSPLSNYMFQRYIEH